MTISMSRLNELPDSGFVDLLGDVAPHAPWVMERTAVLRPFSSVRGLHVAVMQVLAGASSREQKALICDYPELAVEAASREDVTDESAEQARTGLDDLSDEELERFREGKEEYRSKFGFPFILAMRDHDKDSILAELAERLENDEETEHAEALRQIGDIMRYRLEEILVHEAADPG